MNYNDNEIPPLERKSQPIEEERAQKKIAKWYRGIAKNRKEKDLVSLGLSPKTKEVRFYGDKKIFQVNGKTVAYQKKAIDRDEKGDPNILFYEILAQCAAEPLNQMIQTKQFKQSLLQNKHLHVLVDGLEVNVNQKFDPFSLRVISKTRGEYGINRSKNVREMIDQCVDTLVKSLKVVPGKKLKYAVYSWNIAMLHDKNINGACSALYEVLEECMKDCSYDWDNIIDENQIYENEACLEAIDDYVRYTVNTVVAISGQYPFIGDIRGDNVVIEKGGEKIVIIDFAVKNIEISQKLQSDSVFKKKFLIPYCQNILKNSKKIVDLLMSTKHCSSIDSKIWEQAQTNVFNDLKSELGFGMEYNIKDVQNDIKQRQEKKFNKTNPSLELNNYVTQEQMRLFLKRKLFEKEEQKKQPEEQEKQIEKQETQIALKRKQQLDLRLRQGQRALQAYQAFLKSDLNNIKQMYKKDLLQQKEEAKRDLDNKNFRISTIKQQKKTQQAKESQTYKNLLKDHKNNALEWKKIQDNAHQMTALEKTKLLKLISDPKRGQNKEEAKRDLDNKNFRISTIKQQKKTQQGKESQTYKNLLKDHKNNALEWKKIQDNAPRMTALEKTQLLKLISDPKRGQNKELHNQPMNPKNILTNQHKGIN